MKKLLAIDIDGTLINDNNQVSERNIQAIRDLYRKGFIITLATGRILPSAKHFQEILSIKGPIIACNGGIIVDEDGSIIYKKSLDKNILREILNKAEENGIYYHFYDQDTFYAKKIFEETKFFYQHNGSYKVKFKEFAKLDEIFDYNTEILKCIFMDNDLIRLDYMRKQLMDFEDFNVTSSFHNNLELMNKEVDKGRSFKFLLDHLALDSHNTYAVGDGDNDREMLEFAGLGVAMSNGSEGLKEVADLVSQEDNNNDGLGLFIENYLLR